MNVAVTTVVGGLTRQEARPAHSRLHWPPRCTGLASSHKSADGLGEVRTRNKTTSPLAPLLVAAMTLVEMSEAAQRAFAATTKSTIQAKMSLAQASHRSGGSESKRVV